MTDTRLLRFSENRFVDSSGRDDFVNVLQTSEDELRHVTVEPDVKVTVVVLVDTKFVVIEVFNDGHSTALVHLVIGVAGH